MPLTFPVLAPVLALETAGPCCAAHLTHADGTQQSQRQTLPRGHAEALVPMVQTLLTAQPTPRTLLCNIGPGSFTGVRVGLAAAHGFALAWGAPVLGVSAFASLAAALWHDQTEATAVLAIDALKGRLYLQSWTLRNGQLCALDAARVGTATDAQAMARQQGLDQIFGPGFQAPPADWPDARWLTQAALLGAGEVAHAAYVAPLAMQPLALKSSA